MNALAAEDRETPALEPLNAMLDLFEHSVTQLIALGAEPQLRERVKRLLPSPPPVSADATAATAAGSGSAGQADQIENRLRAAQILTACKTLSAFKLTADQHGAIAILRQWAVEEIARTRPGDATEAAA